MKRRGFSLVELLVIIAIVAILAAILFPVLAQSKDAAAQSQCIENVQRLLTANIEYANDYDGYLVPGAETHNAPFYPNGYIGSIDWSFPWNADTFWDALIYPYVRSGSLVGSMKWGGANGEAFRAVGGAYNCPQFLDQRQSEEYGLHNYLSPAFNQGAIIDWGAPNGAEVTVPWVQSFSNMMSPSSSIFLGEKGLNGVADVSSEALLADEYYWSKGVGANGAEDNSNLLEVNGDCDWQYSWGQAPNGSFATTACNSLPRFRHSASSTIGARHSWPQVQGRVTNVGYCDGHARSNEVGSILWYRNVYQPGIMAAPY